MKAFHSNWTKPFMVRHSGDYFIEDFELLTTILSALKWQEFNGDIKMVTDLTGYDYYRKLGIDFIWNLGIDYSLEELVDHEIDPYTYWAAGKLYALKHEIGPCAMIDTDFIIWNTLAKEEIDRPLSVIHREQITESVYPPQNEFQMKRDYRFNEAFNWELEPCNTAFLCINDEGLKDYYTRQAISFMKGTIGRDPLIYMVFAEQRLISMCAEYKNISIHEISDVSKLFNVTQTQFTHVWGYKKYLRQNLSEREKFCRKCIRRILKDYPNMLEHLEKIECLQPYLRVEIKATFGMV